jgi:hypothetical protein
MQRVNRFARYWDLIANSGRFKNTLPLILRENPFDNFMQLSDCLYQTAASTWNISLRRLFIMLFNSLAVIEDIDEDLLLEKMKMDYQRSGEKTSFESLLDKGNTVSRIGVANKRQKKMLEA